MPFLTKTVLIAAIAASLVATSASAFVSRPAAGAIGDAPVVQVQFLGKGNTPAQEVRRIFSRHLYQGSFIGRSVRQAAGANAVLRDERVVGQYGQCSFVTYRGGRAIVCNRI